MAILNEIKTYADAVLNDKIIACIKYKWAVLRFLNDLEKRDKGEFDWDFDERYAETYLNWMTLFKHSKGELAGQYKQPCDYEKFVYGNIYGWWSKDGNGIRRFRQSYEQLARKQAKSQNKAIQAIFEISAFGELNAEAYIAATKKEQCSYVFSEAEWIINNSELRDRFKCAHDDRRMQKTIQHIKSNSFFARMSKDDRKSGDGSNPHFAVLDEYHLHETAEYYHLMTSGMALRKNPLLSIITTAGFNLDYPCYKTEYNLVSRILRPDDPTTNDRYFVAICEVDRNETPDTITTADGRKIESGGLIDELGSETAILKSNPVTGYCKTMMDDIIHRTEQAKIAPENMRNLLTKTYNIWTTSRPAGFLDMQKWGDCQIDIDELLDIIQEETGGECWVGVDLSKTIDLTAVGFVFKLKDNRFAVLSHAFMPSDKYHERMRTDKVPYDVYHKQGYLTLTDGAVVDYDTVVKYILETVAKHGWAIRQVCLDPWASTYVNNLLQNEGIETVEIQQSIKKLSEPTKLFRDAVYTKRLLHDGDPLLAMAAQNAVTRSDSNGNIVIAKERSTSTHRIDPLAAVITGFAGAVFAEREVGEGFGVMFI